MKYSFLNHTSPDIFNDVASFMAIGQPEVKGAPYKIPSSATIDLAIKLIREEVVDELIANLERLKTAYSFETMAAIMDDAVDSVYVIAWMCVAFDLPFNAHWHEVQKANMSKFPKCELCFADKYGCQAVSHGITTVDREQIPSIERCMGGYRVTRNAATGKILKPANFETPDHWRVLHDYWSGKQGKEQEEVIERA